jgi:hypothetical protein
LSGTRTLSTVRRREQVVVEENKTSSMAGSKHDRSEASGGEVSPLAAQLQQAWMHTQMPKTAKRSSITAPSSLQQQSKSTPDHHHHESYSPRSSSSSPSVATDQSQSALKSLSSIFPELAALTQQEKKPIISSVFKDGEYPDPTSTGKDLIGACPATLFLKYEENTTTPVSQPNPRSFSASVPGALHGSKSLEQYLAAATGSAAFLRTSQSFSAGNNNRSFYTTPAASSLSDAYSSDQYRASTLSPSEAETSGSTSSSSGINSFAADVDPADPNTFYSYLNDLMDDEPEENKCMFVQASAFQAMAKELGDLIGDHDSPTTYSDHSRSSEKDPEVERWLEDILSGPLPAEVPEQGLKDETTNTKSFANHESAAVASHEDLLQIFDSGNNNNDSWTAAAACNNGLTGEVYVPGDHGGGAGASPRLSMIDRYKQLDSVFRSEVSEDVNDVLHMPNMSSHVPKPIMSQQLSNGHHAPPVDLSNLLLR